MIDVTDELRADLVGLSETLDSIRALVESLDRDPSVLIRGRRADGKLALTFEVIYGHAFRPAPKVNSKGEAIIRFDLPRKPRP